MTTTAVRLPPTAGRRESDMRSTFQIAQYSGRQVLRAEDAARVGAMRRLAKARLNFCGLEPMTDDAILIVSELVTNAILHSRGTQITFAMSARNDFLTISVTDEMPGRPEIRNSDEEAECGRGLQIVRCLTAAHDGDWGVSADGATTWCRLATTQGRQ